MFSVAYDQILDLNTGLTGRPLSRWLASTLRFLRDVQGILPDPLNSVEDDLRTRVQPNDPEDTLFHDECIWDEWSVLAEIESSSDSHVKANPAREALTLGVITMNNAATRATVAPPKSDRTLSHRLMSQSEKKGRLVSSTKLKSLPVNREESLYARIEVTPVRHSFTKE